MSESMQLSQSVTGLVDKLQTVQGLVDVGENTTGLMKLANQNGAVFDQRAILLDVEASIVDLQGALFTDQATFVDQLVDQVQQSRDAVDNSGADLLQLIEENRSQLVLLSTASIVLTLIIYWFCKVSSRDSK